MNASVAKNRSFVSTLGLILSFLSFSLFWQIHDKAQTALALLSFKNVVNWKLLSSVWWTTVVKVVYTKTETDANVLMQSRLADVNWTGSQLRWNNKLTLQLCAIKVFCTVCKNYKVTLLISCRFSCVLLDHAYGLGFCLYIWEQGSRGRGKFMESLAIWNLYSRPGKVL